MKNWNEQLLLRKKKTITYKFTGSVQTFIVPKYVKSIRVECYGGCSSIDVGYIGSGGGYTAADIEVTPEETLYLYVGAAGRGTVGGSNSGGGAHGGNSSTGNTGGGSSDIRTIQGSSAQALASRLIVAGGSGGNGGTAGGTGGGNNGGVPTNTGYPIPAGGISSVTARAYGTDSGVTIYGACGSGGGGAGGGEGALGDAGNTRNCGGAGGAGYTHPTRCTNVVKINGGNLMTSLTIPTDGKIVITYVY